MRILILALGGAALLGLLASALTFRSDMASARARLVGQPVSVTSPFGTIEYAMGGSVTGPTVLIVHGAGGGFDQGALLAEILLDDGMRWIAPSRFGYLGSTVPQSATYDDQAHAYAWLLDHLEVDQVAVVALSAGGGPGLLLAMLHPERVSSLTLLSAGVTSPTAAEQDQADRRGAALARIFQHDVVYWGVTKLFKNRTLALMGVDAAVAKGLSDEDRDLADRLIDVMHPVSLRSAGAAFDNTASLPGARIASVTAPTLIVHATDDTLQLFEHADFASRAIPGAHLLEFDHGGHFVALVERDAIREHLRRHVLGHSGEQGSDAR